MNAPLARARTIVASRKAGSVVPRLPPTAPGLAVGLFGGSFDPPHSGHRLASELALKRLGLDRIWWLVSPGNPLKDVGRLPAASVRLAEARRIARHPRFVVTDVEAALGTRYTADTIERLKVRAPQVHFVWLMGADNLASFHRWERWRDIAAMVPIAVIDRPGATLAALASPAAHALARWRLDQTDAALLPRMRPPAWVFLTGPRSFLSSTALRALRDPA